MAKESKQPWPTRDAMQQIYTMHLWGGKNYDFYSGIGSHDPQIINPYLNVLMSFLKSHEPALNVCDLGCGDFNIGKQLVNYTNTYIAIDIVESLIDRNKNLYKEYNLEFQCLDIIEHELPSGDCVIIRQVLQHLCNKDIKKVLEKLANFKYIIITEHLPLGNFVPNKDIISGQGIRLKKISGVDVLKTPFNLKVEKQKNLDEYILKDGKSRILTTLFKMF